MGAAPKRKLRVEVEAMIDSDKWDGATAQHLVALYEVMHEEIYGVAPSDVSLPAHHAASSIVEREFGGDAHAAIDFARWFWEREAGREKWRRQNGRDGRRADWRVFLSAGAVSDYRVDCARRGEPVPTPMENAMDKIEAEAAATAAAAIPFKRDDQVAIAERLLLELRTDDVEPVSAFGAMHVYDAARGIWTAEDDANALSRRVQKYAGLPVEGKAGGLKLRAADVSGAIKLAHAQASRDKNFFADPPRGIAFGNGFVALADDGTIELTPHAPENRARFAYAFDYDEKHPRKGFIGFVRSLFRDDEDADAKLKAIAEFVGASMFGVAPTYQRCLVAHGAGNNGKSALLDVVSAAMPPGSTCAVAPQSWGQEYRRDMLAGKLLNVVSELPEQDILATEAFKAVISGDLLDARPIRGVPYSFRPSAGHIFAANALPGTPDQTDGFWRRLLVLTFNRVIADDERDPHIARRLIAEELPGIVMWLLKGAARVMRQGHYTTPASHERSMREWRRNADQIGAFVDECTRRLERNELGGILASDLYRTYTKWATANGHRAVSSTKFGLRLRALGVQSTHTSKGNRIPLALSLPGKVLT